MNPAPASRPDFIAFRFAGGLGWLAVLAVFGCIQVMVTRACGYDLRPVAGYAFYFLAHVCLPGCVALALLNRRPLALTTAVALGVPTGFAIEIFSFLGLAAMGAKGCLAFRPLVWLAVGAWWGFRHRASPVRVRLNGHHAGLALALALLFLGTTLTAASNLFAESPLIGGLPQRPIFHDWIYLVSRAAAVKNLWPLEDPSLAGSSLQYHYFMLVHVASASWVTGLEVTTVLLRLMMVPLGFVLVTQVFVLGRLVSRSAWGGVLAAVLLVGAGEVGFVAEANQSVFLGRFVRWLYVSPTFYFGMVFFAALLLALERWRKRPRVGLADALWLCLLAATTAGAKGTVLPVVIPALSLWVAWRWWLGREFPLRLVAGAACVAGMFGVIYWITMSNWGTAAMAWAPFDVYEISDFWKQHQANWQHDLARWLPTGGARFLSGAACALIVLVGTEGVRLLALPFLLQRGRLAHPLVGLLGAVLLVGIGMGSFMQLDGDGELYLFLMIGLPAAVLAAGFLTQVTRAIPQLTANARRSATVFAVAVAAALCVQVGVTTARTHLGLHEWVLAAPERKPDADMQRLHEALLWVRTHTEPDAVLVANTWTPETRAKDHWNAVDHTLAGVHYYYSAIAERRMLVEGPNYLLNVEQVRQRLEIAAKVFAEGQPYAINLLPKSAWYALLDRTVAEGAKQAPAGGTRVFANERIEIYRLPPLRGSSVSAIVSN